MEMHLKEVFHLPDLLTIAKPPNYLVAEHEFQGCDFHGPAIFAPFGTNGPMISGCTVNGGADALIEVQPDRHIIGAFGFQDCVFVGCTFTNIGFLGIPDFIAKFKAALGVD